MADAGLIRSLVRAAKSSRDKILLLLETLTHLEANQLRSLTVRDAVAMLRERKGAPFVKSTAEALVAYAKEAKLKPDDYLFVSKKKDTLTGMQQPVGRIQVWRILRAALVAVFGTSFTGVLRFIRQVFAPVTEVVDAVVSPEPVPALVPVAAGVQGRGPPA